jgi:hypothetical protein
MSIKFGKKALELADRVLMRGPGIKKIIKYVLTEALGRQKKLSSIYYKRDSKETL